MIEQFKRNVIAAGLVCLAISPAAAQQARGTIEAVTLYRGEALVRRVVPFEAKAGPVSLVVTDLPEHVVADSLYAGGGNGLQVRAVRYRTRAVSSEPREEVRKLDEAIEALQGKLAAARQVLVVVGQRTRYIDRLEGFVTPTAKLELSRGVLKAETLKSLTLFIFEQRAALSRELLEGQAKLAGLSRELLLLQRKRQALASGHTRTVREAVVFLDKQADGKAQIQLSYLVSQASWRPLYTLRAAKDGEKVSLSYNAAVTQLSGEDWPAVQLVLSTASPRLRASGPDLAPFIVSLGQSKQQAERPDAARQRYAQARQQLKFAQRGQMKARGWQKGVGVNMEMNRLADQAQQVELQAGKKLDQRARAREEGLSVSYEIAGRVSLASRQDQQLIEVAGLEQKAQFYHVAVPLLSPYVYEHAEITNDSELALLAGNVAVYRGGRFKGYAEILEVAPGQQYVVGFGVDSQLRSRRLLLDKTELVRGGNKELSFRYRLVIESYKTAPVKVRLFDRIPQPAQGVDIRVSVGQMTATLSKDPLYLRDERPIGILRWSVEVPASARGAKAFTLEYGYALEFDRKLMLSSPTPQLEQKLQEQFRRLQEKRYRK